jgi:flagellar assembly factor FliW
MDVPDPDVAAIGATTPSDVLLLAIVTMGSKEVPATANLQGPLVINLHTRLGRQIAVADPQAPVRAPLDLARSKVA